MEGEILRGLHRLGWSSAGSGRAGLPVASRTDRGVSARGNAVLLDVPLPAGPLLRGLNGFAPDLFFRAAHAVQDGFRPRAAIGRTYRYFEPRRGHDPHLWGREARAFTGRVDVRSLGRGLPSEHPVWRDVSAVRVGTEGDWMVIEIVAPSFVWGMVRKVIAALRAVEAGRLSPERLRAALRGEARLTLPLAEPERLVLWEVSYPFAFEHSFDRWTVQQRRFWTEEAEAARLRYELASRIAPEPLGPDPSP